MPGYRSRVLAIAVGVTSAVAALSLVGCSPSQAASSTAGDPGAVLVKRRCTICHTQDRIDAAKKDTAGWNATIDRMRTKGAVVSEAEQQALVAYLVSR